jgi:hypothetical protein
VRENGKANILCKGSGKALALSPFLREQCVGQVLAWWTQQGHAHTVFSGVAQQVATWYPPPCMKEKTAKKTKSHFFIESVLDTSFYVNKIFPL